MGIQNLRVRCVHVQVCTDRRSLLSAAPADPVTHFISGFMTVAELGSVRHGDGEKPAKEEDIRFLSESAYADACRPGSPRDPSVEEIAEFYKGLLQYVLIDHPVLDHKTCKSVPGKPDGFFGNVFLFQRMFSHVSGTSTVRLVVCWYRLVAQLLHRAASLCTMGP